jgi:hypothetical protein
MKNEIEKEIEKYDNKFKYMLLSRMQSDCNYYLGYGNGCVDHLWASTVERHIAYMKALHNSFAESEKPQWLTMEEIEKYELEMINYGN